MSKSFNKFNKFNLDRTIKNSKFDFCKNLKWFMLLPIVIVFIGMVLFGTIGFNLGIDFTGGTTIKIYTNSDGLIEDEDYDVLKLNNNFKAQIREVLGHYELTIADNGFRTSTMKYNDVEIPAIEIRYQDPNHADHKEAIRQELQNLFKYTGEYENYVSEADFVSASTSQETLTNAFIAMLVAIALILIYVAFRFEITSGLAAILALFHDLLVITSLVIMFRITINASFVAALVTILGYSINNTIIIFDRIRENIKTGRLGTGLTNAQIANASVRETMSRSVFTTLTTLITIGMVAIIGVSEIRQFAIPIIIGIVAGFYSSVFITPGLWAIAYRPRKKKKKKTA